MEGEGPPPEWVPALPGTEPELQTHCFIQWVGLFPLNFKAQRAM